MPYHLHILVNDFALRAFRETADKDYVHARLAYRSRLIPQFRWSSLHCLEKYMKCILLLNRIATKEIQHTITLGLTKLKREGKFEILLSDQAKAFISKMESGGSDRYYELSYDSGEMDLPMLDRTVWEIRRYCQPLDYDSDINGQRVNQLEANLQYIRNALKNTEKGTCVNDGWLENVINNKKHSAREPLIWNNLHFGPSKRRKILLRTYVEAGNAPLFNNPQIIEELDKYIKISKESKAGYRELAKSRNAC